MRALGTKLRQLFLAIIGAWFNALDDFATKTVPHIATLIWGALKVEVNHERILTDLIDMERRDPDAAFAATLGVALLGASLSGPAEGLAIAAIGGELAKTALEYAMEFAAEPVLERAKLDAQAPLMLERNQLELAAEIPLMPTKASAQLDAELPLFSKRAEALATSNAPFVYIGVDASTKASLPWIPILAQHKAEAARDVLPYELTSGVLANIQIRPAGLRPNIVGKLIAHGHATESDILPYLAKFGVQDEVLPWFVQDALGRVSVPSLCKMRFRGIITDAEFYDFGKRAGYDAPELDAEFEAARLYPSDLTLFSFMEAHIYDSAIVDTFGLDDELADADTDALKRAGVADDLITDYWRAHWQHPGFAEVVDMARRDILNDINDRDSVEPGSPAWEQIHSQQIDAIRAWFRLTKIPPHWRERMIAMHYTRLSAAELGDAYDLGLVDDSAILREFLDQGFKLPDARLRTLWTKVKAALPDLIERYKNGWISPDDVMAALIAQGLTEDQAAQLYQRKIAGPNGPVRTQPERQLTKAEIIKGIKKGIIQSAFWPKNQAPDVVLTHPTGEDLLGGLGYSLAEAQQIILINLDTGASPDNLAEFEHWVELDKATRALPAAPLSPERLSAETEVTTLRQRIAEAQSARLPRAELDAMRADLVKAEYRLSLLRGKS